jgi:hypothetical protein
MRWAAFFVSTAKFSESGSVMCLQNEGTFGERRIPFIGLLKCKHEDLSRFGGVLFFWKIAGLASEREHALGLHAIFRESPVLAEDPVAPRNATGP